MVKEIRKVTNRSKANYIRSLQHRQKLAVHFSDAGYVSYDTEEFKAYSKTARRGRPPKIQATV